jgi:intracellular sulfur oxidation DsrE/DsrF family protein
MGFLAASASGDEAGATSRDGDDRPIIGIKHKGPIKVVFEITTPEMKNGVSKGLFYLKKVRAIYLASGIRPDQLDIHAVFHGEGATHLLTDVAWNRVRKESGGNPSTALISELAKNGVHVELCNNRRIEQGWAMSDVHPGVLIVKSAFLRLIDLQQSGYAYIRL